MQKKSKKEIHQIHEPSHPALKQLWTAIEWIGIGWACFVIYKYLEAYPLVMRVFESILPSQSFFPAFSALILYFWNIILWAGILAGALSAGFLFLKRLKIEWHSSLEKFLFAVSLGYGFLSLFILLLASLHLLYQTVYIVLWTTGVAGFLYLFRLEEFKILLKESYKGTFQLLLGGQNSFLVRLFLWIYLVSSLVMAFVPDLFYDALVYHLGVPNLYLQEHGLVRIPGATSKFPLLWQMLYSFGLALSDEMIPKLLHWSSGLLIALGCGAFANRFGILQSGLRILPALFFLSVPMVQMNIWTSGIDVGSCLFAFFSLYALVCLAEPVKSTKADKGLPQTGEAPSVFSGMGWVVLAALMSGFAFGSKYQGGIIAATNLLLLLAYHFISKEKNFKLMINQAVLFCVIMFVTILPWLVKNFWDTGNPLYPFLSSLFQRLHLQHYSMDPDQWETFIGENRKYVTTLWKDHWKLLWELTFKNNQGSLSYPGPLFLTFLPLSLLALQKIEEKWFQVMVGFLIIFFAFSFNSTHLTRYHLQGYPVLCLFFAMGFSCLWEKKNFFFKLILSFCLMAVLLENVQTSIFIVQNSYLPWNVLAGRESREGYRLYTHPGLNPYPSNVMFRWMEKNLPKKSRTLLVGESKNFDLHLPYLYTDVHGQNPLTEWASASKSPEELFKKFQEAGITHLFVNFMEAHRTYGYKMIQWQGGSLALFNVFWDDYVREVHREIIPEKFFNSNSVIMLYEVLDKENAKLKGNAPPNPLQILAEAKSK